MKKKSFLIGILAIVLVFGMTVIGCASDDDDGAGGGTGTGGGTGGGGGGTGAGGGSNVDSALNGTWGYTDNDGHPVELKFNNGNYESKVSEKFTKKGTYTTSGNNITMTLTHYYGTCKDLDRKHLPGIEEKWYSKNDLKTSFGSYFTDTELNQMFPSPQTTPYSISGNILTTTGITMTKK